MINAIIAATLVSALSLLGALLMLNIKWVSARYGSVMISVAAGVMLATAILGLLPEALEMASGHEVYWVLLLGVCVFFVMERMLHWFHHHQHGAAHQAMKGHKENVKPTAYLILVGDSLHNFFDGLAIATAFSLSFEAGVATTLAIMFHEIPQELADFVALIHSGMKVKKALLWNFITALTAILGAVLGWYFISAFEGLLVYMLAFNAGMFIYISCSDLIPALHEDFKKELKWLQTVSFLLGAVLMGLLFGAMGHSHEVGDAHSHMEHEDGIVHQHLDEVHHDDFLKIPKTIGDSHLEAEGL